jgi:hypothetical protein
MRFGCEGAFRLLPRVCHVAGVQLAVVLPHPDYSCTHLVLLVIALLVVRAAKRPIAIRNNSPVLRVSKNGLHHSGWRSGEGLRWPGRS